MFYITQFNNVKTTCTFHFDDNNKHIINYTVNKEYTQAFIVLNYIYMFIKHNNILFPS